MNGEQINLVQESFGKVVPIADTAAALFYGRLFDIDPALEPLFKGDMVEQGRKLMQMIGVAVKSLDRLEQVLPAVRALGARHAGYGVREKDYDTVGSALIWTLKKGLGDGFTPETEAAWAEVYTTLAGVMKDAQAAATQTEAVALSR
jgi:hemoglobin-like flavoprotein